MQKKIFLTIKVGNKIDHLLLRDVASGFLVSRGQKCQGNTVSPLAQVRKSKNTQGAAYRVGCGPTLVYIFFEDGVHKPSGR